MNLTKPSKLLYMSYSGISADGKSMNPAYLIGKIKALFPDIKERRPAADPIDRQIMSIDDAVVYVSEKARVHALAVCRYTRIGHIQKL